MNKLIRDGKVGVLYSPGFGAGWSTWNNQKHKERLLFDPKIIELVELLSENDEDGEIDEDRIKELLDDDSIYTGGAHQLKIEWIKQGTQFYIHDYDGSESIKTKDSDDFIYTA